MRNKINLGRCLKGFWGFIVSHFVVTEAFYKRIGEVLVLFQLYSTKFVFCVENQQFGLTSGVIPSALLRFGVLRTPINCHMTLRWHRACA